MNPTHTPNCGNCLMDRVEIVVLDAEGNCPVCDKEKFEMARKRSVISDAELIQRALGFFAGANPSLEARCHALIDLAPAAPDLNEACAQAINVLTIPRNTQAEKQSDISLAIAFLTAAHAKAEGRA